MRNPSFLSAEISCQKVAYFSLKTAHEATFTGINTRTPNNVSAGRMRYQTFSLSMQPYLTQARRFPSGILINSNRVTMLALWR
jgi:hypothetical protein